MDNKNRNSQDMGSAEKTEIFLHEMNAGTRTIIQDLIDVGVLPEDFLRGDNRYIEFGETDLKRLRDIVETAGTQLAKFRGEKNYLLETGKWEKWDEDARDLFFTQHHQAIWSLEGEVRGIIFNGRNIGVTFLKSLLNKEITGRNQNPNSGGGYNGHRSTSQ